jgi:hypothetical protein
MKCAFCKSEFANSLGSTFSDAEGICNSCTDKLFDRMMSRKKSELVKLINNK